MSAEHWRCYEAYPSAFTSTFYELVLRPVGLKVILPCNYFYPLPLGVEIMCNYSTFQAAYCKVFSIAHTWFDV